MTIEIYSKNNPPPEPTTPPFANLDSYRNHIPAELRRLKIWLVHIGKRPILKWTNPEDLFTFDKALEKLANVEWIAQRRHYLINQAQRPDLANKPAALMVVLSNTEYWYSDWDYRKVLDEQGNFKRDDNNKILKKDRFDDDQHLILMQQVKNNWGYKSSSGLGYHIYFKQTSSSQLCKIGDRHLNLIAQDICPSINGKYLAPYELKHDVAYIPPVLAPINDQTKIQYADESMEQVCSHVTTYRLTAHRRRPSRKSRKDTTTNVANGLDKPLDDKKGTTPQAAEGTTPQAGKATLMPAQVETPDFIEKHKDLNRLIAQYRWMTANNKKFIPDDHDGFGGFIRRLVTLGIDRELLKKLCRSQAGYDQLTDDYDIDGAEPYPDPDKQARICFDQLKKFGFDPSTADIAPYGYPPKVEDGSSTEPEKTDKPLAPITGIVADTIEEVEGEVDPIPIDVDVKSKPLPQLTAGGDFIAFASPPGAGKSTQVWHWMRELNEIGYTNIHIGGDQLKSQAKAKMRKAGCAIDKTVLIDVMDKRRLLLDELIATIDKAITDHSLKPDDDGYKKPVGIICLDPAPKILRALWWSIPHARDKNRFDPNSDEHAHIAIDNIVRVIAKFFNCCLILIAHPPKNAAGRDRYPGSEAWAGDAGITYRLYGLNRSTAGEMPTAILDVFKSISQKERSRYRVLSSMGKSRYYLGEGQAPDYLTHMPREGSLNAGRIVTEVVSDEINLNSDKKEIKALPDKDTYVDRLKAHLLKTPEKWWPLVVTNREIGFRDINKHYAYGIIWATAVHWEAMGKSGMRNQLFWKETSRGMQVMTTAI